MTSLKPKIALISLCLSQYMPASLAALPFASTDQSILGYIAPLTLNTFNFNGLNQKAYRPWFENGAWQGDLVEYDISVDATQGTAILNTSIDLGTSPPGNSGSNWSARLQLDALDWDTGRKIITSDGNDVQIPFRWGSLNASQKALLDPTAAANNDPTSDLLNFIRGDRSLEGSKFRQRHSVLGDIIHSNPIYVGPPNRGFPFSGYAAFRNAHVNRAGRIYVGANDGMLHVFDASNGNEIYAYIPSVLLPKLAALSVTPYVHTYYVDGGMVADDANFGTDASPDWHTILVGGYGHGAKGLFALDITDPDLASETAGDKVLWEISSDSDLGNIFATPNIALLNDGKWYAVTGNGYNSTNGKAVLVLIELSTGTIKKIPASTATGNGLGGVALVDTDYDWKADYAYAGDLLGNLWKFDLTASDSTSWGVSLAGTPLFTDPSNHPIIAPPDLARHPSGGYLVYFGTSDDPNASNPDVQHFYAVWDKNASQATDAISAGTLHTQSWTAQTYAGSQPIRTVTTDTVDWNTEKGWKIALAAGESLQSNPVVRGGRVQFITTTFGGDTQTNWLMELDYLNGSPPASPVFDLNDDKQLSNADNFDANGDGDTQDPGDVVAGMRLTDGLVSSPMVALVTGGLDTMFINNLQLAFAEPCTQNCTGGFQGGHIDVDTDSPNGGQDAGFTCTTGTGRSGVTGKNGTGFADSTDGHQHEYDKAHGQVYVDYVDLEPLCDQPRADGNGVNNAQNLNRVEEVGIDPAKKFIVLIANADLSPGGVLTIGTHSWNVVEYQKLIQQKLSVWDGSPPLVDDQGNPLLVSINDIKANGGTLRISFDDRAIIDGGLHPTQTSCVKDQLTITNGRWRNGALTLQLLDASQYQNYEVQAPSDLKTNITVGGQTILLQENGITYGGLHVKCDPQLTGTSKNGAGSYSCQAAAAGNGFLYESTLFWHFGELYKTYIEFKTGSKGSKPCYGDTEYDAARQIEQGGIPPADVTGFIAFLKGKIASASKAKDQKKYQEMLDRIQSGGGAGNGGGTPVNSGGQPASVTGTPIENNPTPGPKVNSGRRSWLEIILD